MQTLKTRTIAILGAVVTGTAALAISAPAQADVARAHVTYVDLDTASHAGQKALAGRIGRAADQVCGANDQVDRFATASCRAKAVDKAYADLQMQGVTLR